jgi:hypothetical protein
VFVQGRDRRGPIGVGAEIAFRTPVLPGEAPRQGASSPTERAVREQLLHQVPRQQGPVRELGRLAGARPGGSGAAAARRLPGISQFFVSEEDGTRLFWTSAVLMPAAFAVVGIALAIRRRWATDAVAQVVVLYGIAALLAVEYFRPVPDPKADGRGSGRARVVGLDLASVNGWRSSTAGAG